MMATRPCGLCIWSAEYLENRMKQVVRKPVRSGRAARAAIVLAILCLSVAACSQMPASVDIQTLIFYNSQVDEQHKSDHHPLIGMYRATYFAQSLVKRREDANTVNGDLRIAAVKRGGDIDFVSLSGYRSLGGWLDQGRGFSINMQGATLWSFPYEKRSADKTEFKGSPSRIFNAKKSGTSTATIVGQGLLRIQTTYDHGYEPNTYFLIKMQEQ